MRPLILSLFLLLHSAAAYAMQEEPKKGCEDKLRALTNTRPFPKSAEPLSMLENPLEATADGARIQIDARGASLTIALGRYGAVVRVFPDGQVKTQGVGGGTPRADGSNMGIKIAHMSPVIAKGLIRYAYYHAHTNAEHALWRTMEFIFNETPELFMAGWNRMYGHENYKPKQFKPGLDLDQ